MKYKKGDKVTVKSLEELVALSKIKDERIINRICNGEALEHRDILKFDFSSCNFLTTMFEYCGRTLTIHHTESSNEEVIFLKENSYAWRGWMFKEAIDDNRNLMFDFGE